MANPFQAAYQGGQNAYAISQRDKQERKDFRDQQAIANILDRYNNPDDPLSYNQTVNQILGSIRNPQQRQNAMAALQQQEQMNQERLARERKAKGLKVAGLSPELADLDPALLRSIYTQKSLDSILNPGVNKQVNGTGLLQGVDQQSSNDVSPQRSLYTEDQIAAVSTINPQLAGQMQKHNENVRNEIQKRKDQEYKRFIDDRTYHSKYSQEQEQEVNATEERLIKNKQARELAKNAYENEDLSFFSWDNIANMTGLENLRTARGAQLVLAAKDTLINNLGKVSARGQNLWLERRMASMFPQVGQNLEANQTMEAMLEGEDLLDSAYVNAFNKIAAEDEEKYGYVRKDASKRARKFQNSVSNDILKRTAYRTKVIAENEILNKGLSALKKEVGKEVPKGTPLTVGMAKLYKEKYGENYKKKAAKDGYTVPSYDDVKMYLMDYDEYLGTF